LALSTPVEQIKEKLKRADEHLLHLERTLADFQDEAPYGAITNYDAEQAREFRDRWENRVIPPRFPVVAGEVLQQLRSSLTYLHVALIVRDGNVPDTRSQFPILSNEPTTPETLARYQAQVRGVRRPEVLAAIKRHQPYENGNSWLSMLGAMTNIDKHEAVTLVAAFLESRIGATKRTLSACLAFPQAEVSDDPQPVCTVLRQCSAGVREIIGQLEPFLAR
jgi:hypothetical protein